MVTQEENDREIVNYFSLKIKSKKKRKKKKKKRFKIWLFGTFYGN